jgi:glycosyltransferase involved in cell wall biosynthesis
VSSREAETLSTVSGRRVWCTPMAVSVPDRPVRPADSINPIPAFVGGVDYGPNFDAVAYFRDELGPDLGRHRGLPSRLDVLGFCTKEHRRHLEGDHVRLLGYATDLHRRLLEYSILVVPLRSGTGIKTKIVEALMMGMIVVSTPAGLAGLDLRDREHCYVFATAGEFAACLDEILRDPAAAMSTAENGRRYAERHFAPDVLRERWREILDIALSRRAAA